MIHFRLFAVVLALMGTCFARGTQEPQTMPANTTMSAIRIHDFGGREVLKLERAPRPAPGEGELLVRVHAASVNPVDWKIRAGKARGLIQNPFPYIPGFDISGVVEQVGPRTMNFKPGDAVFAFIELNRGGAYAEYAIVLESEAASKPKNVSHVEAAGVPLVALTAWQALFDTADLKKVKPC